MKMKNLFQKNKERKRYVTLGGQNSAQSSRFGLNDDIKIGRASCRERV